jgi:hypothetical protein
MRKLLLGAAAAAAMVAPGVASADTSGNVGFTYESNDFDYGEFDGYSLGGALVHGMSNGWTLQADGRTTLQDWDSSSGNYSHSYAAAHMSTDVGGWDVGGFAGMVN